MKTLQGTNEKSFDSTAAQIAEVSAGLAEIARRHGLDLLAHILDLARLEASEIAETPAVSFGASETRSSLDSSTMVDSYLRDRLNDFALIGRFADKVEQANRSLQRTADIADEAVDERRTNLRDIEKAERRIQRVQSQNVRKLERLVDRAA